MRSSEAAAAPAYAPRAASSSQSPVAAAVAAAPRLFVAVAAYSATAARFPEARCPTVSVRSTPSPAPIAFKPVRRNSASASASAPVPALAPAEVLAEV